MPCAWPHRLGSGTPQDRPLCHCATAPGCPGPSPSSVDRVLSDVLLVAVEAFVGLVDDVPDEMKKVVTGFLLSAREHKAIVDKFGRFPHRNKVLERDSTDEELIYLATGAKTFGQ